MEPGGGEVLKYHGTGTRLGKGLGFILICINGLQDSIKQSELWALMAENPTQTGSS